MIQAILSFDVDAESPILVEGRRWADSPMVMSHQAYGPEVGVPRLLELLAGYSLPATFFVPGYTADRYPEAVDRIAAAGQEIGHHGYSHHSPLSLDEGGERADLERGLEALERRGVRPAGYRTPSWEPSSRTFALLAEHGFDYDSTLMIPTAPISSRRTPGRSSSSHRTGASTTGTSTATSPGRSVGPARSIRRGTRSSSGGPSWTG